MMAPAGDIGTLFGILLFTFVTLLTFGADLAPNWAKSRVFLIFLTVATVVAGSAIGQGPALYSDHGWAVASSDE
jgi:membrane associated rhomboid family serine protease